MRSNSTYKHRHVLTPYSAHHVSVGHSAHSRYLFQPFFERQCHTHTQTHTQKNTHTYTYAHAHTHTHTHTRARTRTHTHKHTHTQTRTHTYTHLHTCTHTHTHKQTRTHKHAHTNTHARTHAYTLNVTHAHPPARARAHSHTHSLSHTHAHACTHLIEFFCCNELPAHTYLLSAFQRFRHCVELFVQSHFVVGVHGKYFSLLLRVFIQLMHINDHVLALLDPRNGNASLDRFHEACFDLSHFRFLFVMRVSKERKNQKENQSSERRGECVIELLGRHRETERQRDRVECKRIRKLEKERDRQINRQTDRETDRETETACACMRASERDSKMKEKERELDLVFSVRFARALCRRFTIICSTCGVSCRTFACLPNTIGKVSTSNTCTLLDSSDK